MFLILDWKSLDWLVRKDFSELFSLCQMNSDISEKLKYEFLLKCVVAIKSYGIFEVKYFLKIGFF